ncbi:hypothetical protein HDU97_007882 [Phlyctochytrium planicorne]|nr:hypothetical protein HDU97_007882 [Phlyctochytrium planicorne]
MWLFRRARAAAVPCKTITDVTWDVNGNVWKRSAAVPDRFNSNGRYYVRQVVKGEDMNFIKMRVFFDLVDEAEVCVGYIREGDKLQMIMSSTQPEVCPDKFVRASSSFRTCGGIMTLNLLRMSTLESAIAMFSGQLIALEVTATPVELPTEAEAVTRVPTTTEAKTASSKAFHRFTIPTTLLSFSIVVARVFFGFR